MKDLTDTAADLNGLIIHTICVFQFEKCKSDHKNSMYKGDLEVLTCRVKH